MDQRRRGQDGQIVGIALLLVLSTLTVQFGCVEEVAVDSELRGRGFSKELVRRVLDLASELATSAVPPPPMPLAPTPRLETRPPDGTAHRCSGAQERHRPRVASESRWGSTFGRRSAPRRPLASW